MVLHRRNGLSTAYCGPGCVPDLYGDVIASSEPNIPRNLLRKTPSRRILESHSLRENQFFIPNYPDWYSLGDRSAIRYPNGTLVYGGGARATAASRSSSCCSRQMYHLRSFVRSEFPNMPLRLALVFIVLILIYIVPAGCRRLLETVSSMSTVSLNYLSAFSCSSHLLILCYQSTGTNRQRDFLTVHTNIQSLTSLKM